MFPTPAPVAQLTLLALIAAQHAAFPPASLSQPPASPAAQPAPFAADWEEKEAYTLLKLSSHACFVESSGNKIKGLIPDLELILQM